MKKPSRKTIKAFLQAKNTTLWGRSYNVAEPAGLDEAADWLLDLFEEIKDFQKKDKD